jgi:Holliday junction resolvase RusA-like endonuclease
MRSAAEVDVVAKRKQKPVEGARVEPMSIRLTIPGAPRTKKTSNRVFTKPFPRVLPSAAHEAWYATAKEAFDRDVRALAAAHRIPIGRPVQVSATFYRDRRSGDLVGYQQALADFLEGEGILVNDKYVVSWDGTRLEKDAARPRIEIAIEVLDERGTA